MVIAVHFLRDAMSSESQRYRAFARMPRAQVLDRSHNFTAAGAMGIGWAQQITALTRMASRSI